MPKGMIGSQTMNQDDIFTGTHGSVIDGHAITICSIHILRPCSFLFDVAQHFKALIDLIFIFFA